MAIPPYAFVTLVSSDYYLPGALTLAAALKDVHTSPPVAPEVDFELVCLVTPETVDVSTIKLLRKAYHKVIGVEVIVQNDSRGLDLLGRPDLDTVLTKLHVFRLTQYSKVVFLDSDVLPVQPISHLFTIPHEFSAAPDVGWPDIFNSGVLVLSPGEDKYAELNSLLKSRGSWDGGDQGILNEWRGQDWNRLSFTYNTTPTAAYTYAPAYERFGSSIKAIHFIGPNKPWSHIPTRPPQCPTSPHETHKRAYDFGSLLDKWFAVYDRHYRAHIVVPQKEFEVSRYVSAWDGETGSGAEMTAGAGTVYLGGSLGLDELRDLALHGVSASTFASGQHSGEGAYQSMPLEGRVDLMRPPPSPPKQVEESLLASPDQGEKTPVPSYIAIPSHEGTFALMSTLPTPGPHEMPPTPHLKPTALVFTPPPRLLKQSSYISMHAVGPQNAPSPLSQQQHNVQNHPDQNQHQQHSEHHQHQHSEHQDQARHENHQHANVSGEISTPVVHHSSSTPAHHGQPPSNSLPEPTYSQSSAAHHSHPPHPPPQHVHTSRHQQHDQQQPSTHEVKRPASPPMMSWNPALEPPPNDPPPASAFPAKTYFRNVWDSSPGKEHDRPRQDTAALPPSCSALFKPPPNSPIPEPLRKQGHYKNVTGDLVNPSPDLSKVRPVFPWEEKPRHAPGRVFPDSEMPPNALFIEPVKVTPASSPVPPSAPGPSSPPSILSPLGGLLNTLSFVNAWDTVPSIQTYATKLMGPPKQPAPLAAPFDEEEFQRSRNDNWEEGSRDGDDEDEGDEDEDTDAGRDKDLSPPRDRPAEHARSQARTPTMTRRPSLISDVSEVFTLRGSTKTYRVRGVQTAPAEVRSVGVQVMKPKVDSVNTPVLAAAAELPAQKREVKTPPMTPPTSTPASRRSSIASRLSPTQRTPSMADSALVESANLVSSPADSPLSMMSRARMLSESSVASSPSSAGPLSPSSAGLLSPPSVGPMSPPDVSPLGFSIGRKSGRVFNPARGVDVFKRGSEEVLARFLRMGSVDDGPGGK